MGEIDRGLGEFSLLVADDRQDSRDATTPATRVTAVPLPLSSREREIATLVRDGMSNKDIAAALTMSVRTVEGHIYRVCNKLGLANRTELAGLMGQFRG